MDVPIPYNRTLENAALPPVENIKKALRGLLSWQSVWKIKEPVASLLRPMHMINRKDKAHENWFPTRSFIQEHLMEPESLQHQLIPLPSADVTGHSRLLGNGEVTPIRTPTVDRDLMTRRVGGQRGRVGDSNGRERNRRIP